MVWILGFYLCICIGSTVHATICRPSITEGQIQKPEIGGFISLECETSTCGGLKEIVFEKEDHNAAWIPVFEGVNDTYHKALDTNTEYSLGTRYDYYAFRTKHSLHINPLILQDHGKWRCVAYNVKQEKYEASPLDFNIYVPPTDGNVVIRHNNSDLVTGQPGEFICLADGVHPEPEVLWEVNGEEYSRNAITQEREDQLWDVMSTIEIRFDSVGVYKLNCVIRTQARDRWLVDHINITVQEPAFVLYPQHNSTETVDVYSTFSLSCGGSGFNPHITWERDGKQILTSDTRYIIKEECDQSTCEGSITSKPMDPAEACVNKKQYTGLYSCVIKLEPPFESSEVSATLKVTFSEKQCKEILGLTIGLSMLAVVCVALVAFGIGLLVYRKQKKKEQSDTLPGENEGLLNVIPVSIEGRVELNDTHMVSLARIRIPYEVEDWLHICAQFREYDNVVLFDYGSKRVFIHGISGLTKYRECTCDMKIHAMIRTSEDRFVVTEHITHNIYLLQLRNETFHTLDSKVRDSGSTRTLICAETGNSFIKCEFSGDDSLHYGIIYRVGVTDDKLEAQQLTPKPFTVKGEPYFISRKSNATKLVIVTHSGIIYTVDLEKNSTTPDESFVKYIDGVVMSLYIDTDDNIIIGDKGGQIHVYTHDDQHNVKQNVHEPVGGIAVIDRRTVICYGKSGQQQYIEVLETIKGERNITLGEEIDHITPTYSTQNCLKLCVQSPGYEHIFLFDYRSKRVFKHDITAFNKHTECTSNINIYDMMRIMNDKFVVTELDTHEIHLLQLKDRDFHKLHYLAQDKSNRRTLICAENENNFIKCEFNGDDSLHEGIIYRVNVADDKLRQHQLTPKPFTIKGEPWFISLTCKNTRLVIVSHSGIIYTGDLEEYSPIPDDSLVHYIDGVVRSLYIDLHENIMIGDRSGKIRMYTPDKQYFLKQDVQEHVRGIKVIDGGKMIVCHGKLGEQQHIKIFSFEQLHQL